MRCGIALGSNLGDRLRHLQMAAAAVARLGAPGASVLRSRIYETEPDGCAPGSPFFLNAVMEIEAAQEPATLLAELQAIEGGMGRERCREKNAPRPIDLDILYWGAAVWRVPPLEIPHPRLAQRRFVLAPLADIRPELVLPGQAESVAALLAKLPLHPAVTALATAL